MSLRELTNNDLELVRSWRNAPQVRRNMYTNHEISYEEHQTWFQRIKQDPTALWFMYVLNDIPLGVIYFVSYQPQRRNAFWGFYSGANAPRGTGLRMEYDALEYAFTDLALHKLNCEVIASNQTVINMHKKCGFVEEGIFRDFHYDGERYLDVIRLGMLQSEWLQCRSDLAERISKLSV